MREKNRKITIIDAIACLFIGFFLGWNTHPKEELYSNNDIIVIDTFVVKRIIKNVSMSVYQPTKEQCDDDFLITADGSKIDLTKLKHNRIKWCAVSRDLWALFPKDKPKLIEVKGMGVYEVRDVMNQRYKKRIDLLIHPDDSFRLHEKDITIKIIK
ncbi:hypothetical protein [uncultured Bacteroides sp.]|uniref:hypothetical protein n=1 Tax=uncultured Bacteroides sp. TaxID=162156 RepID=UPI00262FB7CA|nr:hypothetical protein [uncultured Bacteroides sp.]